MNGLYVRLEESGRFARGALIIQEVAQEELNQEVGLERTRTIESESSDN